MRWLTSVGNLRARREHGAVATIVTVLVTFGVVLGMLAYSADLGSITSQRRFAQNSSDAAVMRLAIACSKKDGATCSSTATTAPEITGIATANSTGVAVTDACASAVAQTAAGGSVPLNLCPVGNTSDLGACIPASATTALLPYVEVRTRNTANTPFGGAIGAGSTRPVPSCARAAWGPPGQYSAKVPIVVSECEWKNNTSSGTVYQTGPAGAAPGYGTSAGQTPWPAPSAEITIMLKSTTTVNCAINGKDTAGGFGYVQPTAGCGATVSINDWAQIDTGSSPPDTSCYTVMNGLLGTVIQLPIFDCLVKSATLPTGGISGYPDCTGASGGGSNSYYHIKGWAKFYLTGYKIGGGGGVQQAASLLTGTLPCNGGDRCISGWYVTGTLVGAGTPVPPTPDNSFGANVVVPAG